MLIIYAIFVEFRAKYWEREKNILKEYFFFYKDALVNFFYFCRILSVLSYTKRENYI